MNRLSQLRVASSVTLLALGLGGVLFAQTPGSTSTARRDVPRATAGKRDLNGVWDFTSAVPLQRPAPWSAKYELTESEAAEYTRYLAEERVKAERARGSDKRAYDLDIWYDDGRNQTVRHTSLIIDPPDGRLPPLTEAARRGRSERRPPPSLPEGPEDYSLGERCLIGLNAGPPIMPSVYNNYLQIFQTRNHVALYTEMIHTARIVALDTRPHLDMPQWNGNSRGRWEGDTLVIETKGFRAKDVHGPGTETKSDAQRVVERFTRLDADTLQYEFTVHDPETYVAPWTARTWMKRKSAHVYEYACHEGNYSISDTLKAARQAEREKGK